MTINLSRRNERGAVAIFLAITVSTVLLITGALAVDLGNAWARGRDVQRQVDVAALSAAPKLPVTTTADRTAAAQAVLDSMKQTDNSVSGQSLTSVTATTLLNNNYVTFQRKVAGSWVDCAAGTLCTQMTVTAPNARVQFGLAAVSGHSHANVTKHAVVRVSTQLPIAKNVMPFWLPNGCSFGPAEPDTTGGTKGGGGGGGAGAGAGTVAAADIAPARVEFAAAAIAPPSTTATPSPITPGVPAGQHTIGAALLSTTPYTLTPTDILGYTIANIQNNNLTSGLVRFVSPDGTTVVDAAVSDTDNIKGNHTLVTGTFTVPPGVSSIPGAWKVYGMVLEGNGSNETQKYSSNFLTLTVTGSAPSTSSAPTSSAPTSGSTSSSTASSSTTATATATGIPVGCTGQDRGEFGQLESPRMDVNNPQQALQYNISAGLDHNLVPYKFTDVSKTVTDCAKIDSSQPAHYNDDVSKQTAPYNNCIQGDTGNDGPKMYDGFISGVNAQYTGRLNTGQKAPHTTCPNNPGSRADMTIGSFSINNDVLSCYLQNGATLNTLIQDTGVDNTMLNGLVTKSPRFIWLPVVYANDRTVKNWQPIKKFVPAFITDEEYNTPASSDNGIYTNGNSLSSFRVFTFNPAALPANEQSPIVDYDPTLGNPIYDLVG